MPIAPVLLGGGERLFDGLADALDGYECVEFAPSAAAAHVRRDVCAVFDTMEAMTAVSSPESTVRPLRPPSAASPA